ncbi:hypothetical protein [Streptomyces cylindrosporus]|uniref:Uncharacterized protein n=1 Tax=Streptomyces cylindrosporus TaxID=2927583 RepID=A0ABS9Y2K3_9ACTN|nr:hypothetical protein [Streptomyces cylindrosporus]MCI3271428.1 hypothetical protein [Streptomyces cylindrosporus]
MAYIGHRCKCGHSDLHHTQDGTGKTLGRCTADYGKGCSRGCSRSIPEPEVIPSFDGKGRVVERVIEPGDGLASMSDSPTVRTCPCEACVALYAQVTATQPA